MIAAQQEELNRKEVEREAATKSSQAGEHKQKGVRILPPSPVTVRKMMVEEELKDYDTAVTRTTPVTKMMESKNLAMETNIKHETRGQLLRKEESLAVPGWNSPAAAELLEKCSAKYDVDQAFDQLVAESENHHSSAHVQSHQQQQSFSSSSQVMTQSSSTSVTQQSFSSSKQSSSQVKSMSAAEECRRSFEEAELEAMALESISTQSQSFSKQSSMVETGSVQSFVYQPGTKPQRSNSVTKFERSNSQNSEDNFRSRKTLR